MATVGLEKKTLEMANLKVRLLRLSQMATVGLEKKTLEMANLKVRLLRLL